MRHTKYHLRFSAGGWRHTNSLFDYPSCRDVASISRPRRVLCRLPEQRGALRRIVSSGLEHIETSLRKKHPHTISQSFRKSEGRRQHQTSFAQETLWHEKEAIPRDLLDRAQESRLPTSCTVVIQKIRIQHSSFITRHRCRRIMLPTSAGR